MTFVDVVAFEICFLFEMNKKRQKLYHPALLLICFASKVGAYIPYHISVPSSNRTNKKKPWWSSWVELEDFLSARRV